jgi:ubiquinone/menaquinone biosynthesis C-methylase UbiE
VDYAMLFNILHAEQPERLLREARRILAPHGLLGIIHWNYDPSTPRGPSMEIRPARNSVVTGQSRKASVSCLPES